MQSTLTKLNDEQLIAFVGAQLNNASYGLCARNIGNLAEYLNPEQDAGNRLENAVAMRYNEKKVKRHKKLFSIFRSR